MRRTAILTTALSMSCLGLGAGCQILAGLTGPDVPLTMAVGGGGGALPLTCSDDVRNSQETDKDCGGVCPPCGAGKGCAVGPDCQSKSCVNGTCAAAACDDDIKNGTESDVDCGGACPSQCGVGKACGSNEDCQSLVCANATCAPSSCSDGARNGDETDIDCGGVSCGKCADGKDCSVADDCQSQICDQICKSNYSWATRFGNDADQEATAVAVDGFGNLAITGRTSGAIDFGTGPQPSASVPSPFLLSLDSMGNSLGFGGVYAVQGMGGGGSAVGISSGGALVAGNFNGAFNLTATTTLSAAGFSNLFLASVGKFGGASGKTYDGGSGVYTQSATSMAVDAGGNVILAGNLHAANFGCGALASSTANGLFVVKLSPQLDCLWSKGFGDGVGVSTPTLSVDSAGNVVLGGAFFRADAQPVPATLDFGAGHIISTGGAGVSAAFITKLSANMGIALWAKRLGDSAGSATVSAVAVDGNDSIVLAGAFDGSIDLGGGALTAAGEKAMFLAKMDAAGAHAWSYAFGDSFVTHLTKPRGVAVDKSGSIVVAGDFDGTLNFGGGALTSKGSTDVFIARVDSACKHLWSRSYGDESQQTVGGIGLAPGGGVVVVGGFAGRIDFGGGPLVSAGGSDIFVASLMTP